MTGPDRPGGSGRPPGHLLAAKTRVPPPPEAVTRAHERLLGRLVGWEGGVAVVARAGFGKSALLAAWAARETRHVAWLTLDPGDAGPERLASYLLAAVAPVLPPTHVESVRGALSAGSDAVTERVVPLLLDALERTDAGVVLVLDGIEHLPPDAPSWLAVRQLLGYRPPGAAVALAGRVDPPFGLARARSGGRLVDVEEHDLVLDADDLDELLAARVPAASPAVRRLVAERAEGWPAVALLAALLAAERGVADREGVDALLADEGAGYLAEEVVAGLDDDVADALGVLAHVASFDVDLLAAVVAPLDAHEVLGRLRDAHLVDPLDDGRGLRVWEPLGQVLLDRTSSRLARPQVRDGLRAAGRVLADRDEVADAVRLLAAGAAEDELADLVASHWGRPFEKGDRAVVDEWLDVVGDERIVDDARLLLARAHLAVARRDAVTARWAVRRLGEVEPREPTDGSGDLAANLAFLRAQVALRFDGDAAVGLREARTAVGARWGRNSFALSADVTLAVALIVAGQDDEAVATVRAALRREGAEGTLSWAAARAVGAIAAAYAVPPRAAVADQLARSAWEVVVAAGATSWTNSTIFRVANASARLATGDAFAAAAELVEAERLLARGLDRALAMAVSHLHVAQAAAVGDLDAARSRLEGAVAQLGGWVDPGPQVERFRRHARRLGLADQGLPDPLTERELEVLRALPRYATRGELAEAFHVSVDTVKSHLGSAYRKLGVSGRAEALRAARRLGLL